MPVVLLVRHGQASFGADDYDVLSDLGRQQSSVVGDELARRGLRAPVAVHGHPAPPARHGRAGPAAAVSRRPRSTGAWDEYDHLDLLERYALRRDAEPTARRAAVQVLLDHALGGVGRRPTPAAGPRSPAARPLRSTELAAVAAAAGQDAVVFTSGGVIAAVCAGLLGVGADGVVALNRVTANGAITKLVVGPRRAPAWCPSTTTRTSRGRNAGC